MPVIFQVKRDAPRLQVQKPVLSPGLMLPARLQSSVRRRKARDQRIRLCSPSSGSSMDEYQTGWVQDVWGVTWPLPWPHTLANGHGLWHPSAGSRAGEEHRHTQGRFKTSILPKLRRSLYATSTGTQISWAALGAQEESWRQGCTGFVAGASDQQGNKSHRRNPQNLSAKCQCWRIYLQDFVIWDTPQEPPRNCSAGMWTCSDSGKRRLRATLRSNRSWL